MHTKMHGSTNSHTLVNFMSLFCLYVKQRIFSCWGPKMRGTQMSMQFSVLSGNPNIKLLEAFTFRSYTYIIYSISYTSVIYFVLSFFLFLFVDISPFSSTAMCSRVLLCVFTVWLTSGKPSMDPLLIKRVPTTNGVLMKAGFLIQDQGWWVIVHQVFHL